MRAQRVFPLIVELRKTTAARESADLPPTHLLVRPLIPGAQVTPAELPLDPREPTPQATFYITPVARGRLAKPQIQLYNQGRLVQEISLRMRSVTQRLTWILLALTVLIPAFLLNVTKFNPLTGTVPVMVPFQGDPGLRPTLPGGAPLARPPQPAEPLPPVMVKREVPGTPWDVLEHRIKESIPEIPNSTIIQNVAWAVGWAYHYALELEEDGDHPSFYVGAVLLGLTLICWLTHISSFSRALRRGKPFVLQTVSDVFPA
jgi:hypothetical protein